MRIEIKIIFASCQRFFPAKMSEYKQLVAEFEDAEPFHAAIALANHRFMAIITLVAALVFLLINFMTPKVGTHSFVYNVKYTVYSLLASGLFGVGVIFLSNTVGVYV